MDIDYLKQLIALLEENKSLSEMEIEEGENRIRLVKTVSPGAGAQIVHIPQNVQAPTPSAAAPAPTPVAPASPVQGGHEVRSPIVGTFYRAASPENPAFVEPGQRVEKGQTLCIVEAMKLMNEIESDASGTILKVFVDNGKPVEYNQPLFLLQLD